MDKQAGEKRGDELKQQEEVTFDWSLFDVAYVTAASPFICLDGLTNQMVEGFSKKKIKWWKDPLCSWQAGPKASNVINNDGQVQAVPAAEPRQIAAMDLRA